MRYVDDFALFQKIASISKMPVNKLRIISDQLRLKIHSIKSQLFATRVGVNFVGFRVLSDRIRIRSNNGKYVWSKETTLAKMANDPEIRAEISAINTEYAITEMDGLEDL